MSIRVGPHARGLAPCVPRRPAPPGRRPGSRSRAGGFSIVELLGAVVILGLVVLVAGFGWKVARARTATTSAARIAKVMIYQARMDSIYSGLNHFVVLDPDNDLLQIYADTGTSPGEFDNADRWVASTSLESAVELQLPKLGGLLKNPNGAGIINKAWQLPLPDSGARWGSTLRGVMLSPTGLVMSGEAVPQPISNGAIVFSDGRDRASAVVIRGRIGQVRSYELVGCQGTGFFRKCNWREL